MKGSFLTSAPTRNLIILHVINIKHITDTHIKFLKKGGRNRKKGNSLKYKNVQRICFSCICTTSNQPLTLPRSPLTLTYMGTWQVLFLTDLTLCSVTYVCYVSKPTLAQNRQKKEPQNIPCLKYSHGSGFRHYLVAKLQYQRVHFLNLDIKPTLGDDVCLLFRPIKLGSIFGV